MLENNLLYGLCTHEAGTVCTVCKGVGGVGVGGGRERERASERAGSCMTDREYPTLHTAQLGGGGNRVTLLRGTVEKERLFF